MPHDCCVQLQTEIQLSLNSTGNFLRLACVSGRSKLNDVLPKGAIGGTCVGQICTNHLSMPFSSLLDSGICHLQAG